MIQRIQSVYLLGAIICLLLVGFGLNFYTFQSLQTIHELDAFGIQSNDVLAGDLLTSKSIPFYLGSIILIVLCFLAILMFKSLKTQLLITRLATFIYFVYIIGIGFCYFLGKSFTDDTAIEKTSINFGIYALLIGFICMFLASNGIKKDQRLLASVDRIR